MSLVIGKSRAVVVCVMWIWIDEMLGFDRMNLLIRMLCFWGIVWEGY